MLLQIPTSNTEGNSEKPQVDQPNLNFAPTGEGRFLDENAVMSLRKHNLDGSCNKTESDYDA